MLLQAAGSPPVQAEALATAVACLLAPEASLVTAAQVPNWQKLAGGRVLEPPTWTEGPPHSLVFWTRSGRASTLTRHQIALGADGVYTHQTA